MKEEQETAQISHPVKCNHAQKAFFIPAACLLPINIPNRINRSNLDEHF